MTRDQPRHRLPRLAAALRVAPWVCVALAALALSVPASLGEVAAQALLAVLIGAPLLRVAYLSVRWARRGDLRSAAIGALLLAITVTGVIIGG